MRFYNYPVRKPHSVYEEAIERVVDSLRKSDGIVSIFQLGSVGSPGISDLDVLAVFEDGISTRVDPLKDLPRRVKYPFTHSLFGISRCHFGEAQRHTFFHNYGLLWGESLPVGKSDDREDEREDLRRQVALEFLLARYISMTIEGTYGASSLRNLLLSTHALRYDLEFLDIEGGPFYDLVHRLVGWRTVWFEEQVSEGEISTWWHEFYPALRAFIMEQLSRKHIYLPEWASARYSRNVWISRASPLSFAHRGSPLSPGWFRFGKRAARIQHRFNSFTFRVPYAIANPESVFERRFSFLRDHVDYNKRHLPRLGSIAGNISRMMISNNS